MNRIVRFNNTTINAEDIWDVKIELAPNRFFIYNRDLICIIETIVDFDCDTLSKEWDYLYWFIWGPEEFCFQGYTPDKKFMLAVGCAANVTNVDGNEIYDIPIR